MSRSGHASKHEYDGPGPDARIPGRDLGPGTTRTDEQRNESGWDDGSKAKSRSSPADPVPSLLRESSLALVRSLRDPLHAIALEAETIALAADDEAEGVPLPWDHRSHMRAERARRSHSGSLGHAATRSQPAGRGRGVRGSMRSHRLQRHIASVSRAITMLERVLRDHRDEPHVCDLARVKNEACQFLRAFAARNGHRLLSDERALEPSWAEASESAARLTLVVVMAERLLALPRGSDLSVSVREDPSGEVRIDLEGDFEDGASGTREDREDGPSLGLERLLSSESIADADARVSVDGPTRLSIRFRQPSYGTAAVQAGDVHPPRERPGRSPVEHGPAQARAESSAPSPSGDPYASSSR